MVLGCWVDCLRLELTLPRGLSRSAMEAYVGRQQAEHELDCLDREHAHLLPATQVHTKDDAQLHSSKSKARAPLTDEQGDSSRAGELEREVARLTDLLCERDREHEALQSRRQQEAAELKAMADAERQERLRDKAQAEREQGERNARERARAREREEREQQAMRDKDAYVAERENELQRRLLDKERQVAAWADRYHALEAHTFASQRQAAEHGDVRAGEGAEPGARRPHNNEAGHPSARTLARTQLQDLAPSCFHVAFEQPPTPLAPAEVPLQSSLRALADASQEAAAGDADGLGVRVDKVKGEGNVATEEDRGGGGGGETQACEACARLQARLLDAEWEVRRLQSGVQLVRDGQGQVSQEAGPPGPPCSRMAAEAPRVGMGLIEEVIESRRELRLLQEREVQREQEATRLRVRVAELIARDAERERQAQVLERQRATREAEVESAALASDSLQLQLLAGMQQGRSSAAPCLRHGLVVHRSSPIIHPPRRRMPSRRQLPRPLTFMLEISLLVARIVSE